MAREDFFYSKVQEFVKGVASLSSTYDPVADFLDPKLNEAYSYGVGFAKAFCLDVWIAVHELRAMDKSGDYFQQPNHVEPINEWITTHVGRFSDRAPDGVICLRSQRQVALCYYYMEGAGIDVNFKDNSKKIANSYGWGSPTSHLALENHYTSIRDKEERRKATRHNRRDIIAVINELKRQNISTLEAEQDLEVIKKRWVNNP